MFEDPTRLLQALCDGPVPRGEVNRDAQATLEAAEVDLREEGTQLHLVDMPSYGWASIVASLEAPLDIEYFDALESTNAVARERALAGQRDLAVVAGEQTAGRGRHERQWASPVGGIWCSVVLDPDLPPSRRPLLTLAAAVAVTRVAHARGVEAVIKWPNDVLVPDPDGARKLAGILTETGTDDGGEDFLVLGIGLNAALEPAELPAGATSLQDEAGTSIERSAILTDLLEEVWRLMDSPAEILPAWREHTTTLGREVRVQTGDEAVVGRAVDITDTGGLVIETATDRVTVAAGDCEHLRPV